MRPSLQAPLLVVACLALFALSGCSAPPVLIERTVSITSPLGYAEVDVILEKGQMLQWEWSIQEGQNVLFTIHTHEPYSVHDVRTATQGIGTFEAPGNGTFALYWERESQQTLTLQYRITGDGHLDPMRPPVPA